MQLIYFFIKPNHSLPVNAIQRAYFAVSWCQCDNTNRAQVMESDMMPRIIKKSVASHSGERLGGEQILSRPWIVWHCRTSPMVRAPGLKDTHTHTRRVIFESSLFIIHVLYNFLRLVIHLLETLLHIIHGLHLCMWAFLFLLFFCIYSSQAVEWLTRLKHTGESTLLNKSPV